MRINVAGGTRAGTKPAKQEPFLGEWLCTRGTLNPGRWRNCPCGCRSRRPARADKAKRRLLA